MMRGRTVVTLCGSTRFGEAFRKANLEETLAGKIVLTIGCNTHSDDALFSSMSEEERFTTKLRLDRLHLDKIAISDEILVLNVGGYIGDSTRTEIGYAIVHQKRVRYLEPRDTVAQRP